MKTLDLEKQVHLNNLISYQADVDNIDLYAENPYEAKYQLLINKRKDVGLKYYNDFKAFIEYSSNMDDIYENTAEKISKFE